MSLLTKVMQDLSFSHTDFYLTATHCLPKYSFQKLGFCQRALELLLSSLVPPLKVSMVHVFIFCTLIKYILLSKTFQHYIEVKLPPLILSHYSLILITVLATLIIVYSSNSLRRESLGLFTELCIEFQCLSHITKI